MSYGTSDFDCLLDEIIEQTDRIKNEMDIYKFSHEENINTYNRLVNVLLALKEVE